MMLEIAGKIGPKPIKTKPQVTKNPKKKKSSKFKRAVKTENLTPFFDWLQEQLGYKSMDDWYQVTKDQLQQFGAKKVLGKEYGNCPSKALQSAYPQHKWLPWRFSSVPIGYWTDMSHQRALFDWMGVQLGYKKMDDWYDVIVDDMYKYNIHTLSKPITNCKKFLCPLLLISLD